MSVFEVYETSLKFRNTSHFQACRFCWIVIGEFNDLRQNRAKNKLVSEMLAPWHECMEVAHSSLLAPVNAEYYPE